MSHRVHNYRKGLDGPQKGDHHHRFGRGLAAATWREVVGISLSITGREMTTTQVVEISPPTGEGEIPTTPSAW